MIPEGGNTMWYDNLQYIPYNYRKAIRVLRALKKTHVPCLQILSAFPAHALLVALSLSFSITTETLSAQQTTYTFVSVPFNNFPPNAPGQPAAPSCPPNCRLSGYFTLDDALPPNLVGHVGGSGDILPLLFSFSDGVTSFTDQNVIPVLGEYIGFSPSTDSKGAITAFSFYMQRTGVGQLFGFWGGTPTDITQLGANLLAYQAYDFGQNDARAGGWTIRYSQADLPWGPMTYDNYAAKTMRKKGCAVTSLAMAINLAGTEAVDSSTGTTYNLLLTPGDLNHFMATNGGFDPNHNLKWLQTMNSLSRNASYNPHLKHLRWHGISTSSPSVLAATLDRSAESVIVRVPPIANCALTGAPKGDHFVLVTGKTVNSDGTFTFSINDPGCAANQTLDFYPSFSTRGYITDPDDLSALAISAGASVELAVLDTEGERSGFSGPGSPDSFGIPNSYYYRDSITDDDTGDDPTDITHYLGITTPRSGNYLAVVTGLEGGPYSVTFDGYDVNGNSLEPLSITGNSMPGSSTTYGFTYESTPGRGPTVTITAINGIQLPSPVASTQTSITASGLAYSRVTQTFNGTITLTNISTSTISGPLQLVLFGIPSTITLVNETSNLSGTPYITIPAADGLAPGQSITIPVQFKNPSNATINLSPAIYSGTISQ